MFESLCPNSEANAAELAPAVMGVVKLMQSNGVSHNILICDRGNTVICIPRQNQVQQQDAGMKLAVIECCGLFLARTETQFEEVSESEMIAEMENFVSLPESQFSQFRDFACERVSCQATV